MPIDALQTPTKKRKSVDWFQLIVIALLGVALYRWFEKKPSGPEVGTPAKAFSLKLVDSNRSQVSLDEYRGHPVVIEVFAHWCDACRIMAPRVAELARAPRSNQVGFLGVAVDGSESDLQKARKNWGIPFDVAIADRTFTSNYGVTVLPTIIVLDAEGRVNRVTTGVTSVSTIDGWLANLGAPRL